MEKNSNITIANVTLIKASHPEIKIKSDLNLDFYEIYQ
jgi:hypothetical protein